MAWTSPPDFVVGTVATEANLDALSDDLDFLKGTDGTIELDDLLTVGVPTATTNAPVASLQITAESSGDVVDAFGPRMTFAITDTGGTASVVGQIDGVRDGADNTGSIAIRAQDAGTGREGLRVSAAGGFASVEIADQLVAGTALFVDADTTQVGIGTITPSLGLDIFSPVALTKIRAVDLTAADDTMTAADFIIIVTVSGNDVLLPLAHNNGQIFIVKNATGDSVTLSGNGTNIQTVATFTMTMWRTYWIMWSDDAGVWLRLAESTANL